MGSYGAASIAASELAGVGQNQLVTVRTVSNAGKVGETEWVVNCNPDDAQVLDPFDQNVPIDLSQPPSHADQLAYELWWAVCKGELRKFSSFPDQNPRMHPGESDSFDVSWGDEFAFEVLPLGGVGGLPGLAKARITSGGSGKLRGKVAFVYCSETPTVSWPNLLVELGGVVDHNESPDVLEVSWRLYLTICGTDDSATDRIASSTVQSGVYLFDLLKNPAYRSAWRSMFREVTTVPPWIDRRGDEVLGVTGLSSHRSSGDIDYVLSDLCKPHDCADNRLYLLYSPAGRRLFGLLLQRGAPPRWLGSPGVREKSVLKDAASQ
jgi:hypothetical protein